MPCGLPDIGGASLKSIVLTMQSWALEATPVGGVLDTVSHALQSGRVPTGHPATKPKLLEEWIWLVQLLYDCLCTVLQSLQCCNGKHGILLVQLLKQLGEVCYIPITHTCIITSHIIFAYDNFTHIDCNSMNHQILRDALGLTVGNFLSQTNAGASAWSMQAMQRLHVFKHARLALKVNKWCADPCRLQNYAWHISAHY